MGEMRVLVRAGQSGAWAGVLVEKTDTEVVLRARRLWSWEGALDCSALAVSGPKKGRISAETTVVLRREDVIEIHDLTSEAQKAVDAIEVAR